MSEILVKRIFKINTEPLSCKRKLKFSQQYSVRHYTKKYFANVESGLV